MNISILNIYNYMDIKYNNLNIFLFLFSQSIERQSVKVVFYTLPRYCYYLLHRHSILTFTVIGGVSPYYL